MNLEVTNPRYRVLCIMEIMRRYSDESNILTLEDICKHLLRYNVKADKRAVSSDIKIINQFMECLVSVAQPKKGYYYIHLDEFRPLYMSVIAAYNSPYYDESAIRRYMQGVNMLSSEPAYKMLFETETVLDYPMGRLMPNWYLIHRVKQNIVDKQLIALTLYVERDKRFPEGHSTTRLVVRPVGIVICKGRVALAFAMQKDDKLYRVNFWRVAEVADVKEEFLPFAEEPDVTAALDYFSGKPLRPHDGITISFRFHKDLYDSVIGFWGHKCKFEDDGDYLIATEKVRLGNDIIGWFVIHKEEVTLINPKSVDELVVLIR